MHLNPGDPALTKPRLASAKARETAGRAVSHPHYVAQQTELLAALEALETCTSLGIDTEFVRERTFFAQPGLVQFSDGRQVWLLDPVELEPLADFHTQLCELMQDAGKLKILHSVGEDLEILEQLSGAAPNPLFDTQIAAAVLGKPLQCRYETLVEELLGVELPGGQARNNWRRRPLPEHLLVYAAQDVIWLPELKDLLAERLEQAGRLDWLIEDCARLVDTARQPTDPLLRVKGAGRLKDRALYRLRLLAEWREDQAVARDLPRGFVLKDPVLLHLAREAPETRQELGSVEGVSAGLLRHHADRLLEILRAEPPAEFRRPPELTDLDQEAKQQLGRLLARVRQVADELGIDPALIASKRELIRLLQGIRPDWLDGWRGQLLGPDFGAAG